MSDGADTPAKRRSWLAGRSDRREYWAMVGIVVVIAIAISLLPGAPGQAGSTAALTFIQVRRLHDLGRSGWWAAALLLAQFVVMVPLILWRPEDLGLLLAVLIELAVIVVMGALPGQPQENRFGPPRGKRSLAATFS